MFLLLMTFVYLPLYVIISLTKRYMWGDDDDFIWSAFYGGWCDVFFIHSGGPVGEVWLPGPQTEKTPQNSTLTGGETGIIFANERRKRNGLQFCLGKRTCWGIWWSGALLLFGRHQTGGTGRIERGRINGKEFTFRLLEHIIGIGERQ